MMAASETRAAGRRIWGLLYRHLALYRRSWPRLLELAYELEEARPWAGIQSGV